MEEEEKLKEYENSNEELTVENLSDNDSTTTVNSENIESMEVQDNGIEEELEVEEPKQETDVNSSIVTESEPIPPINSSESSSNVLIHKSSAPKHVSYGDRLAINIVLFGFTLILFILALYSYLTTNTTSNYTEKAKVNYQVCLKKNNYYSNSCLEENVEYLTAISDIIRTEFNYTATYQEREKRDTQYYIKSKLLIKTVNEPERQLLKKEKNITDKKENSSDGNVVIINELVDIPFQEYNEYAQKYKNDYSVLSNCQVIISLIIANNGSEREVASITVPLTKNTYNITKYEMPEQINEYTVKSIERIKTWFLILTVAMVIANLFTGFRLVKFIVSTTNRDTRYRRKLKQILNTYDRVIITSSDNTSLINSENIYNVKSFLELLDVRDTIDKPILYHKVNNVKSEFYVQDIDKVYKYTMKEADFEEPNQGDT